MVALPGHPLAKWWQVWKSCEHVVTLNMWPTTQLGKFNFVSLYPTIPANFIIPNRLDKVPLGLEILLPVSAITHYARRRY